MDELGEKYIFLAYGFVKTGNNIFIFISKQN